jgi:Flp pilus assembly pilin Flp
MMQRLKRLVKGLHEDTSGKMSVEMILLIGLIALPIVIFLILFKEKVIGFFTKQSQNLQDPTQNAPTP